MAKQTINIGSSANDGTGTSIRDGGDLINDNFNEIYTTFGDGTNLSSPAVPHKIEGTNFTDSLLVGHATTGTLSSAQDNTGVGIGAMTALTSGDDNTALGSNAGVLINTGIRNTVLGSKSGDSITSGDQNTAIGFNALTTNGTSNKNTAVGAYALNSATGAFNIAVGKGAGNNISSGSGNVVIGADVDVDTATGSRQLKIVGNDGSTATTWISGDSSGNLTTVGDVTLANNKKVIFGDAGENIVGDGTDLTIASSRHIKFDAAGDITLDGGSGGLKFDDDGSTIGLLFNNSQNLVIKTVTQDKDLQLKGNDGGSEIIALTLDMSEAGAAAFNSTVTADGGKDVILGKNQGTNFGNSLIVGHATTGTLNNANRNVGVGIESLDAITVGDDNTGLGYRSLSSITQGGTNTAIGNEAQSQGTSSMRNSSLGYQALRIVTGNNNIAIGHQAGNNITSGDGNVIIGNVAAGSATGDRQLLISGYDGSTTTTWISGTSSGAITFNSAYTFPTADGTANQVLTTDGSGALSYSKVSSSNLTSSVSLQIIQSDGTVVKTIHGAGS